MEMQTPAVRKEIMTLPIWCVVVAVVQFLSIPLAFYYFSEIWSPDSEAPWLFKVLVTFFPGTILAFLSLMVGYVNKDAGRRGMSRTMWTLIVIFVPNAIGFILYFLMRNPIRNRCPKCGTMTDPRVNYCPNCRHAFTLTCTQCNAVIKSADKFCANCGLTLGQAGQA